jgi:uncharacterized membrane protein YphA (DoxX/SURF4 family)
MKKERFDRTKAIAMQKTCADIITVLFVILFVYAATNKLLDYQKFSIQLGKSPVLASFSRWIAWSIPMLEAGIVVLLIIQKTQLLALFASFSLMVVFSAYIITILNFSEYIPCSCGGILENMSWIQHFWFNVVFVLLGAAATVIYPSRQQEIIAR